MAFCADTLRAPIRSGKTMWRRLKYWQFSRVQMPTSRHPGTPQKEHGKAVPTWNYAVVHASGPLRVIDDAEWLRALVTRLTTHHEAAMAQLWSVGDAPPDYIEKMISAIVGIEIPITKLVGKWKVSQNQPMQNRAGVVDGLLSGAQPNGAAMAALVASKKE